MLDEAYRDREATLAEAERILSFQEHHGLGGIDTDKVTWEGDDLDCEAVNPSHTVALVETPEDETEHHTMVSSDFFEATLNVLKEVYEQSNFIVRFPSGEKGPVLVHPEGGEWGIVIAPRRFP